MAKINYRKAEEIEAIRPYLENYKAHRDQLDKNYEDYFVCHLMVFRTKDEGFVTMSTWTNFINTVMPESDYVMIVLFKYEDGKVVGPKTTYIIEQKKMMEILGDLMVPVESPVKHYILNTTKIDYEKKKAVWREAEFLDKEEVKEKQD